MFYLPFKELSGRIILRQNVRQLETRKNSKQAQTQSAVEKGALGVWKHIHTVGTHGKDCTKQRWIQEREVQFLLEDWES